MHHTKTEPAPAARIPFKTFLHTEVEKYGKHAVPVRSSLLRRLLTRRLRISDMHPNPGDEFCDPKIGPNDEIIGKYARIITGPKIEDRIFEERVIVERIRPHGYMLLNGHHRWAAAWRVQYPKIRVKVVNLTRKQDIQKLLEKAANHKRAALDLDEVVFCGKTDMPAEPALPAGLRRRYPERVQLGIPDLFRFLSKQGYDIWIYTSGYESAARIKNLLLLRGAPVHGVITGHSPSRSIITEELKKRIAQKYDHTLYIDRDMILRSGREHGAFKEIPLSGNGNTWAGEVMDAVRKMRENA